MNLNALIAASIAGIIGIAVLSQTNLLPTFATCEITISEVDPPIAMIKPLAEGLEKARVQGCREVTLTVQRSDGTTKISKAAVPSKEMIANMRFGTSFFDTLN